MLNMFRTLIYPSSGACDYSVELPHWSYCSWFDMCWSFGVVGLEWYPCSRLNTTNVVIQQNNRKLLMMDILMSETCWAHKKWNKITSGIKLVFYSSTSYLTFEYILPFHMPTTCTDSLILLFLINSVIFGKERKFRSPSVRATPCAHISPITTVQYFPQQLVLKH